MGFTLLLVFAKEFVTGQWHSFHNVKAKLVNKYFYSTSSNSVGKIIFAYFKEGALKF